MHHKDYFAAYMLAEYGVDLNFRSVPQEKTALEIAIQHKDPHCYLIMEQIRVLFL